MDRIFWIIEALIISTLLLAVAVAYIHGIEEGINSQLDYIHMLEGQLDPGLERLYLFGYSHPLGNVLFGIGFFLTLCWIGVAAMFLGRRKSKSKT
jgi:hypothetical protein